MGEYRKGKGKGKGEAWGKGKGGEAWGAWGKGKGGDAWGKGKGVKGGNAWGKGSPLYWFDQPGDMSQSAPQAWAFAVSETDTSSTRIAPTSGDKQFLGGIRKRR